MADDDDLIEDNWYDILDVPTTASVEVIQKAYRKLALKYHPDRNPGNDAAAAMFLKIQKALDILTNETTRKEFDNKLQARIMRKKRRAEMDEKTRKMKDILLERERQAKRQKQEELEKKMQAEREMQRLREEARRKLAEEEQRKAEQQREEEKLRELASKVRLGARPQQERDRSCPASVISEHNALEELVLQKMMQAANLQKARQSGGT